MQNCQLTETKLEGFDKRADELNISVKISKINLILAEKLALFSALLCSLTFSSPGTEDGLDTSLIRGPRFGLIALLRCS